MIEATETAQPLLTAVEIAANRSSDISAAQEKKIELPFTIEPSAAEIEHRASANGWQIAAARREVIAKRESDFAWIAKIAPDVAKEVQSKVQSLKDLSESAAADINTAIAQIGAIETLLRNRAQARHDKSKLEIELATITAQLDFPDSATMDVNTVIGLTHRQRHLPALIAEKQTQIEDLGAKLIDIAMEGRFDIQATAQALLKFKVLKGSLPDFL